MASCIDNNDNHMTFVGHIVYLCPVIASFELALRSGGNDATPGLQINYMPSKSHVIVLLVGLTFLGEYLLCSSRSPRLSHAKIIGYNSKNTKY